MLDGNEPEFVILSYDKYKKIEAGEEVMFSTKHSDFTEANGRPANEISEEEDPKILEKLNQEILVLKEEIRQKEEAELVANEQSTEPVAELIDPVRDSYSD
mgnify:FL=1